MRVAPGRSAQCVRELCTMFGVASKHKCVAYVGGLFGMLTCFFFFLGRSPRVWMTSLAAVGRELALARHVWWVFCCACLCPCVLTCVTACSGRVREAGSCWSLQSSTRAFILWQRLNVEARDTIERPSSSLLVLHKASGSSHSPETPSGPLPGL